MEGFERLMNVKSRQPKSLASVEVHCMTIYMYMLYKDRHLRPRFNRKKQSKQCSP